MQLGRFEHKIIDTHFFDVKSPVAGERWTLEVPEEVRDQVRLIRLPKREPVAT